VEGGSRVDHPIDGRGRGGEGMMCTYRAKGGAPTEPLRGEGDNEGSILGGNHNMGKDKRSKHVIDRLVVDLDTVTNNRVHGPIEGYKNAQTSWLS
jgi:hypothetical protein